jgi:hypothetical protein
VYLFCTGKVLEFTGLTAEFKSGLDLVYLADCLYNCVFCTGKLLEFTGLSAEFKSGLDLVYLADCLENYVPLLPANPVLAEILGKYLIPPKLKISDGLI